MTRPSTDNALVGLVVVSHSRALAEAAVQLAGQMVHGAGPKVAVAAGLDDGTLGTDAMAIGEALTEVDGPAGVVVLMDLGSAVLSAELALDLADDPALRDRVVLSSAPLVEGLVAAVVTAAGGASAAEVAAEAGRALAAKQAQLGTPPPTAPPDDSAPPTSPAAAPLDQAALPEGPPSGSASAQIEVTPEHGLHARPVARLVGVVRGLEASVTLTNLTTGAGPAAAGSLTQVALLGALHGHRLRVEATGPDADEAVRRVADLAADDFGEPPRPPTPTPPPRPPTEDIYVRDRGPNGAPDDQYADICGEVSDGAPTGGDASLIRGVRASSGVAVGPVQHLRRAAPDRSAAPPPSDPETEQVAFTRALEQVRAATQATRDATARDVGEAEAAIFDAHLGLLADDALLGSARERIRDGAGAVAAWADAVDTVHDRMAALPDPYLSARAADVRAVGDQVLRALLKADTPRPTGPGILVAADLTPELAAALDPATVQAVVLAAGSPTSHAAILARARGIPAVVAAGNAVLDLAEGTPIAIDAAAGTVTVRPDADAIAAHERRRAAEDDRRASARAAADAPARTVDGTLIHVACNVGSVADARAGAERGAEGAGLVRTELCFVGRADEPDVDEQETLYLEIAQAFGGRRITLRTLDVGGDKPLPFLPVPHEDNPFLGLRGLRLGLAREHVLRRQLAAVVRVARRTPVSVMFPMVTTVDELRRARALLDQVRTAEGGLTPDALQVGIMVEVPAVALNLGAFAELLDFVSIGTNDLTQYALAAERGNPHVAALSDPLEPGVLALIAAAGRAGRGRFSVAVCGEAAADELAVPLLLGLGVDELSVAPEAVPSVKQRVRELDLPACAALAGSALAAGSAARVRALVLDRLGGGSAA